MEDLTKSLNSARFKNNFIVKNKIAINSGIKLIYVTLLRKKKTSKRN